MASDLTAMKRRRGVTLLEVVLATGVAALFLTAFMVQFRVQQNSFQVASDELRLPGAGHSNVSRLLGFEGLSAMWRPEGTPISKLTLEPGKIKMPLSGRTGDSWRIVRWVPALGDPRPEAERPGALEIADNGGAARSLTSPSLIATMSFYSPDLFRNPSPSGVGTTATTPAATVIAGPLSKPAFHVLGAAMNLGATSGGKTLGSIGHSPAEGPSWRFGATGGSINGKRLYAAGSIVTVPFSAGGVFVLEVGGTAGTLVCSWPAEFNDTSISNGSVGYTLGDLNMVRRIGFWMKLNTSPYTGLIAIRDSYFLRN